MINDWNLLEILELEESETLESFFQRPYNDLEELLEDYISRINSELRNNGLINIMITSGLSLMVQEDKKYLKSYQSKTNAIRIIKWLQDRAFSALFPQFLYILKWDFDRRLINLDKSKNSIKYKKKYITKTICDIENELNGGSSITAGKYFSLLLDFFSNFMDTQILSFIPQEFPNNWQEKFYEAYFKTSELKDNINDFVDQDMEDTISGQLSNRAKLIRSGLIIFTNQFDFISNAFAFALIEYQVFLEQILQSIEEGTNEKMPLGDALKKAKECCGNDDIDEALKLLLSHSMITQNKRFENTLINQKARWKSAKRNEQHGIVNGPENNIIFNQIRISVLELITEIAENWKIRLIH